MNSFFAEQLEWDRKINGFVGNKDDRLHYKGKYKRSTLIFVPASFSLIRITVVHLYSFAHFNSYSVWNVRI